MRPARTVDQVIPGAVVSFEREIVARKRTFAVGGASGSSSPESFLRRSLGRLARVIVETGRRGKVRIGRFETTATRTASMAHSPLLRVGLPRSVSLARGRLVLANEAQLL